MPTTDQVPQYLAGDWKGEGNDQPQTLAWIEPDAEHRFYSENCEWEKMDVGGSATGPITCPIITSDASAGKNCFSNGYMHVNANYADIANALSFFVPTGVSLTSNGENKVNAAFSDGSHQITIVSPTMPKSGYIYTNPKFNQIATFAFIGSDRAVYQCDEATTDGFAVEI